MTTKFRAEAPEGALQRIATDHFEVSWAGTNPLALGYCFGSEDGQVVITDDGFSTLASWTKASAHDESVNGVAFSQGWLAVTTRKEVNFINPLDPTKGVMLPAGAFGVDVAPSGHFVIPIGRNGIMFVKPGSGPADPVTISSSGKQGFNVAVARALHGADDSDLIICAGRLGGVGVTHFKEGLEKQTMHTVRLEALDIIDICLLGTHEGRVALAAIGRDGTVVLFRDIEHDRTPEALKSQGITGAAYRVFSAGADIVVLTSEGIFVLSHLSKRFVAGSILGTFVTEVRKVTVELADANLVGGRALLGVGADAIFKVDLDRISSEPGNIEDLINGHPREEVSTSLKWTSEELEQKVEQVPVMA